MNFVGGKVYCYLETSIKRNFDFHIAMTERQNRFSIYSDEELMFYLSSGEVLAFDELYGRYSKRLMLYFSRMFNFNKSLAEDALQDLFLKIAEHPEKFDSSRSFKTWIFSVASNTCKNFYRHKKVVLQSQEELYYLDSKVNETSFLRLANKLDGIEFRKMLEDTLNEVAPEKKEAFILKYQEEKTIAEIASIQGCPEGSVKSRLHYTLKILEEKLYVFNPVI
jgi:RNA polymerase sigma-70 factor, ECF subfamily